MLSIDRIAISLQTAMDVLLPLYILVLVDFTFGGSLKESAFCNSCPYFLQSKKNELKACKQDNGGLEERIKELTKLVTANEKTNETRKAKVEISKEDFSVTSCDRDLRLANLKLSDCRNSCVHYTIHSEGIENLGNELTECLEDKHELLTSKVKSEKGLRICEVDKTEAEELRDEFEKRVLQLDSDQVLANQNISSILKLNSVCNEKLKDCTSEKVGLQNLNKARGNVNIMDRAVNETSDEPADISGIAQDDNDTLEIDVEMLKDYTMDSMSGLDFGLLRVENDNNSRDRETVTLSPSGRIMGESKCYFLKL